MIAERDAFRNQAARAVVVSSSETVAFRLVKAIGRFQGCGLFRNVRTAWSCKRRALRRGRREPAGHPRRARHAARRLAPPVRTMEFVSPNHELLTCSVRDCELAVNLASPL
jgi:hypothetical protein